MKILLIGLSLLSLGATAPLASYDQRQEGELNVKVDLDNFVIVVARPSSGLDLLSSMAGLLADSKHATLVQIPSTENEAEHHEPGHPEEEPKGKDLDDVAMDKEVPVLKPKEEAMIVLVKTADSIEDKPIGDLVRTLRNLKEDGEKGKKNWLSSKYKFVDSVDEPQSLKLIGDAIEGCGPGRSRDRFGICQQERSV